MSAQTGCAELMRRSNPKNGALLYVGNCIEIARGLHRWFRDSFARQREYDDLTEAAASIRPGADGLIFLPYLMGERTPHPDPLARGGFIGLSVRHNLDHLTRAVLEGVAFGLRDGLDLMTESGAKRPEQIRASGGGIRSKLWRQILADVLGAEIATVTTPEGAAFGAAMLAAVSAGWHADVDTAVNAWVTIGDINEPGSDVDRYHDLHGRYQSLYPALQPWFRTVGTDADPT